MYAIELDGGKYTVINDNGILSLRRYGEVWTAANLHSNLVLAMAQRIEELETEIRAVVDGTLDERGCRRRDGMNALGMAYADIAPSWEARLSKVLEQKP